MIESKPWNWDEVDDAYWLRPAEDVRILLEDWKWKGEDRKRLLDLGCGIGRHALLFARAGFEVTGFDLSDAGLSRLRQLAAAEGLNVRTAHGDLLELPFPDKSFDFVLAYRSIYHCSFQGLADALGEARRVLCGGGGFFANFLSQESLYYRGGEGLTDDPWVRMKTEEGGAVLPHCYLDEKGLLSLLSAFAIHSLRLDPEPAERTGSRYYTVLATAR
jgi:SAM-dependent methyltransferase